MAVQGLMEGIAQQLETLVAKEQLHEEVGETEEIPLHVHVHGWFMAEDSPSSMS